MTGYAERMFLIRETSQRIRRLTLPPAIRPNHAGAQVAGGVGQYWSHLFLGGQQRGTPAEKFVITSDIRPPALEVFAVG